MEVLAERLSLSESETSIVGAPRRLYGSDVGQWSDAEQLLLFFLYTAGVIPLHEETPHVNRK